MNSYSDDRWQWGSFRICATPDPAGKSFIYSLWIGNLQYFWGGAWYYNTTKKVSPNWKVNYINESDGVIGSDTWDGSKSFTGDNAHIGGHINVAHAGVDTIQTEEGSKVAGLFWDDYRSADINVPIQAVKITVGPDGRDAIALVTTATTNAFASGKPYAVSFNGTSAQIPVRSTLGDTYALPSESGTLLIIPNATKQKPLLDHPVPFLLGDTHEGSAAKCELDKVASSNPNTAQDAEMYTPEAAAKRLLAPAFFVNANYWDVRPQTVNGKPGYKWQTTGCTAPLGMYFDNDTTGPTGGTFPKTNKFQGPTYFLNEKAKEAPVDTLFLTHGPRGGDNGGLRLVINNTLASDQAINYARSLDAAGLKYAAVSGTALIPANPMSVDNPVDGPDAGEKYTTRVGIGYDAHLDELLLFEGGSYNNGPSRAQLAGIFAAADVNRSEARDLALELDGGGSAALGVQPDQFVWAGATRPASGCPTSPIAWCTKPGQPDGKPRPVPTWLGFDLLIENP